MKTKRVSTLRAFAIGFVLVAPILSASPIATAQENQLSAQMIQDRDYPPRSNVDAGRQILSNAPPVVPGYRQFMGFIFAVLSGEAEIVPLMPPVPEDVSAHTSLTYVTVGGNDLKLDIYSPKNTVKPAPLVVLVHGGCWMDGTREEMVFYAANTPTKEYPNGLGPKVQAIIPLYGWSDLTDASVNYQYYMELFLGSKYADAPKLYEEASPITHVDKQDPPTLLLHGTIDTIVPITQAEKLAKKLEESDVPYVYAPFIGGYHGYDMFKDSNPSVMYLIEEFLAEYLAG